MYPVNAIHTDCNYHIIEIGKEGMGLCGCGKVISEECIGLEVCKCASFEPLVPRHPHKNCPDCITDPGEVEGWIHTNPVQDGSAQKPKPNTIISNNSGCGNYRLGNSLEEAKQIITGERQDSYGNPEDSFSLIAEYWDSYLRRRNLTIDVRGVTALDVSHMMVLFKLARCQGQAPKRDNYIDAQGYLAIAADRLVK